MSTASKRLRQLKRYAYDWPDDLPGIALRAEMRVAELEAALQGAKAALRWARDKLPHPTNTSTLEYTLAIEHIEKLLS